MKFPAPRASFLADAPSLLFLLPVLQPPWRFLCDEDVPTLSLLSCLASSQDFVFPSPPALLGNCLKCLAGISGLYVILVLVFWVLIHKIEYDFSF